MNCIKYISQIKTLGDFVCNRKKLVALSAFAVFVLICGFVLRSSPANANVCFLPDPSMCDDGEGDGGNNPGGEGNVDPGLGRDICEGYTKSFSSGETPQNNCGDACKRCDDQNSPNFGKYLCPEAACGWCDRDGGYTSIKAQNRCGDACEKCDDKFSKSFGKYKCPAETCDECEGYDKTESQIKKEKCVGCVSCPYDKTRWKCTRCNICSGYQYSDTDYQVVSGAFDCEKCPEGDWYKCTPKNLCGDLFDYSNDVTSPNSETFNAYGKRHITCTQCTTSGKYDTKYGYFYCQDDGCQNYNTHQSDVKITSGEYACCKCSPQYLEHDASLDASKFRVNNGDWYNECDEYCKPSEDNFFSVNYLRDGKYSCASVKANNYPDAIRERTSTIRLSCGNKSHSCYYPETICPVADYHWTQAEATAKANDDHYKKNPCSSCTESTSCAYLDYKCANPIGPEGGCDPQTYLYHRTDFDYNYANNKYLGTMAGYNPDTCSKCLASGRSESSRLYANDCNCVTVPSGWYKESDYKSKFSSAYGYSFSIASDYSHTTSGCAPIYSCGNWYYNYNSACMINHCNTSWASTTRTTFLGRPYATSGGLYGFKFDNTSCKCQYLNTIYYNSGSSACYDTCHWCALDYGYDSSYNNSTSWDCDYNCTDCANNAHYDCVKCKNGGKTDCTGSSHPGQWYTCSSSCVNCDGNTLYSGCSPKACPTGEVKETSCSGNFTASGSYSGTVACGHCCSSGYHWNGSQCEVDSCPSGTVTEDAKLSCSEYALDSTRADGVKCYRKTGDKSAYCDSGWSLNASTCYSSSKDAYCAKNGEKCYNNESTPSCGTNQTVVGQPTNCHCDCGDGYCKNASGECVSASGLSCPSDTTASCYKYESSTVSSGGCSKTCTYKVANTPNCGSNAHVTGSGTSCSCECDSGYSGDPFSGCSISCSPLTNESPDSSTCKTTSYSCSDGCTGTRTCYKSACTGSQVCYNKSCCTPKWPSYQGYDYNNCMTSSDGTVSDGCGNTTTKYKSACTGSEVCYNSSCCTPKWPSYQGYDYNNCMTSSDGTVSDGCGNSTTKYKSACTGNQTCKNGSCVTPSCNGGYTSQSDCESAMGGYAYNHKCYGPYSGCYYMYCDEDNGYYDDEQTCDIETGGPCEESGHCFVTSSGGSSGSGGSGDSDCGCDCDVGVPYVGQNCDYITAWYGHDSCTGGRCDCCINY